MQYTDRFGNSIRNDGGPGSGPQGGSGNHSKPHEYGKKMMVQKTGALVRISDVHSNNRYTVLHTNGSHSTHHESELIPSNWH